MRRTTQPCWAHCYKPNSQHSLVIRAATWPCGFYCPSPVTEADWEGKKGADSFPRWARGWIESGEAGEERVSWILVGQCRATLSQTQQSAISLRHKSPSSPSHSQACSVLRPESRCWRETVNKTIYQNWRTKKKNNGGGEDFFKQLIFVQLILEICFKRLSVRLCGIHSDQPDTPHVQYELPPSEISTLIPFGTTQIFQHHALHAAQGVSEYKTGLFLWISFYHL